MDNYYGESPVPAPLPTRTRRYLFHEWLSQYLDTRDRQRILRALMNELKVSRSTLKGWFDLPNDAKHDVPFRAVLYICYRFRKDPLYCFTNSGEQKDHTTKVPPITLDGDFANV